MCEVYYVQHKIMLQAINLIC